MPEHVIKIELSFSLPISCKGNDPANLHMISQLYKYTDLTPHTVPDIRLGVQCTSANIHGEPQESVTM